MRLAIKAICYVGYYFFAMHLPESGWVGGKLWNGLRVFFARGLLRECGKRVHIDRKVNFGEVGKISFKDDSGIGAYSRVIGDVTFEPESATSFGVFVTAYARNMDRTDIPVRKQGKRPDDPVVIGRDTVLFANVVVLPGVKTAEGTVAAAGAIINKSTPGWCIVAGNPAKVVKWRKPPGPEAFAPGMMEIACEIPEESRAYYEASQRERAERRAANRQQQQQQEQQ